MCVTRRIPPYADGEPGLNRSGYYNQYNQGKSSLSLNLKKPEGMEIAKKLVAASDIVSENFAGGVINKMGLGYEVLKQLKSDIIMISMAGYWANRTGECICVVWPSPGADEWFIVGDRFSWISADACGFLVWGSEWGTAWRVCCADGVDASGADWGRTVY